jgi:hypothetical protein
MTAGSTTKILALVACLIASAASALADDLPPTGLRGAKGASLGYGSGPRGREFSQELQVRMPVLQYAGPELRVLVLHDGYPGRHRLDTGGRLGMFVNSVRHGELVRGYASAGFQVLAATTGVEDSLWTVGGSGEIGVELFTLVDRFSFYFELGGASGDRHGFGRGLTGTAGIRAYPF